MDRFSRIALLFIPLFFAVTTFASVTISEIHYDPVDSGYAAGSLREFVEIFNTGPEMVPLAGYSLAGGIEYTFPTGVQIASGAYLLVVRDPTQSKWSGMTGMVYGPFTGKLSNEGETIRLLRPDLTVVEELEYDDTTPWPKGADGYGPSLERISPDLPAGDPHSWRASLNNNDGTPGNANTVAGTPPYPLLLSHRVVPATPSSYDYPTVLVRLDKTDMIGAVTLRYELWRGTAALYGTHTLQTTGMELSSQDVNSITYSVQLPRFPSQSLVRFNVMISLTNGTSLYLPHRAERRPYESFFVYNNEVSASLPILWKFVLGTTQLTETAKSISGVVIKEPGSTSPHNLDGAEVKNSRNGEKIHFIKGQEFRGNGTLNLIPERPAEGLTAGISAPHREDLSFWYFEQLGLLAPRADWFRVVVPPVGSNPTQTQQLGIEQINEDFLERNGRDLDGVLFKRNYVEPVWEPHMNKELGSTSIYALQSTIQTLDTKARRKIIESDLNYDNFLAYAVASMLLTNWDGYHNNHWMYRGPGVEDQWEILPWDQDKAWGYTDYLSFYTEFPLTYPIDGLSTGVSRTPGPILSPLHKDTDFYLRFLLGLRGELDRTFNDGVLFPQIESLRGLLLTDLAQIETFLGTTRNDRRTQINTAYDTIRAYITARRSFLLTQLAEYDPDHYPPLLNQSLFVRGNQILLTFDKELEIGSTETVENYSLTPGNIHPATATLEDATHALLIFPHRLSPGTEYEISVAGVADASNGNPMMNPQTRILSFAQPQVSISEIMYNNRGEDIEWVELHNTGTTPVDISGWYLSDDEIYPAQGEGMCVFTEGTILNASEYVIVNLWGNPKFNLWQFPSSIRIITPTVLAGGSLSNGGDNLALFNAAVGGVLIDGSLSVKFPDLCSDGESLEKIDDDFPWGNADTLGYNFQKSFVPLGFKSGVSSSGQLLSGVGSPGRKNGTGEPLSVSLWRLY